MPVSRHELYQKILRCVAHVVVTDNDELISEGSGFCFLPNGSILTAAHVVCGGWPVRQGEADLTSRKIHVQLAGQDRSLLYRPQVSCVQVVMDGYEPITLDVALIAPIEHQPQPFEHLVASVVPPKLGDEVYMSGYSDEMAFPFSLDNTIKSDLLKDERRYGIKTLIGGAIVKRGVVGSVVEGTASVDNFQKLKITQFYVDNHVHSGASGGPIVDENGLARGIISQRAVTATYHHQGERIDVPSGSCVGYGLDFLLALGGALK